MMLTNTFILSNHILSNEEILLVRSIDLVVLQGHHSTSISTSNIYKWIAFYMHTYTYGQI